MRGPKIKKNKKKKGLYQYSAFTTTPSEVLDTS